jgi:hypothetical protein
MAADNQWSSDYTKAMKYLAMLIVMAAFIWYYTSQPNDASNTATPQLPARPGELSSAEKNYYIQIFNYTMDNIAAETPHPWRSSDLSGGVIQAGDSFISKSKASCRPYSESFNINGYQGTHEGIACKRVGSEGWCRLKKTDALTCALESGGSIAGYPFPGLNDATPSLPAGSDAQLPTGGIGMVGKPATTAPGATPLDGPENHRGDKPGQSYADTVTGTAGGAAGPATGGALQWFNETFR